MAEITRTRREPPPFVPVTVTRVEDLSPYLRRVVVDGATAHLLPRHPAMSIRVLFPIPGRSSPPEVRWTGNQFEIGDGSRAPIRTFTPVDDGGNLAIDIVRHDAGLATDWVRSAGPGDTLAISGPGRIEELDAAARSFLVAGDESALPAISQLLAHIPTSCEVGAHVEIRSDDARIPLPAHPGATVRWHVADPDAEPGSTLVAAVEATADLPDHVWVAGEAASVQRIRRHLLDGRGRTRADVTARGYWKLGRSAT